MDEDKFFELRKAENDAYIRLVQAVRDACPGPHHPIQHRDGNSPWCRACGRTDRGYIIHERFWTSIRAIEQYNREQPKVQKEKSNEENP